MSITQPGRLVDIAEVARPHGIRGELRLKLYNPDTEVLGVGKRVLLRRPAAKGIKAKEESVRILAARPLPQGALLVQLEGVADRDAAEAMRGAVLCVPRDELPEPEDGEFYACDIEGARAELVSGELVGTVRSLATYPTCEVLVIDTPAGTTLEIPLVDDVIAEIDAAAHVVKLKSAEGL